MNAAGGYVPYVFCVSKQRHAAFQFEEVWTQNTADSRWHNCTNDPIVLLHISAECW